MTLATMRPAPTAGALRVARALGHDASRFYATAALIDRESGLRDLTDILEEILAEAGDLIETRSPELVAHARAALLHISSPEPRQAE
jgi:hypothetical protein